MRELSLVIVHGVLSSDNEEGRVEKDGRGGGMECWATANRQVFAALVKVYVTNDERCKFCVG
jgi:hypothetical protein